MARDLSKEKMWRRHLQTWRDSGLTVAQFCALNSLTDHNFRSWQATIKQRDEEQFQKVMAKKQVEQPVSFVPVTLVQELEQSKRPLAPLQNKLSESKSVPQQLVMKILTPTGNIF